MARRGAAGHDTGALTWGPGGPLGPWNKRRGCETPHQRLCLLGPHSVAFLSIRATPSRREEAGLPRTRLTPIASNSCCPRLKQHPGVPNTPTQEAGHRAPPSARSNTAWPGMGRAHLLQTGPAWERGCQVWDTDHLAVLSRLSLGTLGDRQSSNVRSAGVLSHLTEPRLLPAKHTHFLLPNPGSWVTFLSFPQSMTEGKAQGAMGS